MKTEMVGTMTRFFKRNNMFHADIDFILPQVGSYKTQTERVSMATLPSSLAHLRACRIRPPIRVRCEVDDLVEHREDQHDGIEAFTMTTRFEGTVRVVDLYTSISMSASRSGRNPLLLKGKGRTSGHIRWPRYYARFNPSDMSVKYLQYDNLKGPGQPLDAFDQRIIDCLRATNPHVLTETWGGWTRFEVELRGLALPWVPGFIRDAPKPSPRRPPLSERSLP